MNSHCVTYAPDTYLENKCGGLVRVSCRVRSIRREQQGPVGGPVLCDIEYEYGIPLHCPCGNSWVKWKDVPELKDLGSCPSCGTEVGG